MLNLLFNLLGKKKLSERLIGSLVIKSSDSYKEIGFKNPMPTEYGLKKTIEWYLYKKSRAMNK